MSKLYFEIEADYNRVIKLREEIEKLKNAIISMDVNKHPEEARKLEKSLQDATKEMRSLVTQASQAGAALEMDFKNKIFDASQSVNGFTEKIINQKAVVKDVEADVKRLGEVYRSSLKSSPMSASGKLSEYSAAKKALDEEKAALFNLTQEQANARLSVKKLRDEYSLYQNEGKEVVNTNNGIGMSLSKAFAIIGGATAIKKLGSEIIRVRGEFQSMQTAIETLVGKDIAGKLIPQIKEMAKVSPLTLTDFVSAEKMMLGFNIEADKTIRFLQALSDISMGNSQKFNSLTLAFSQMSAAGKLMGQDLNQMINAGFNPLQTISEKTGKSIAVLKEEMSKGAISTEMVQQAFVDATSAGGKFYQMSENASKTINGQLSMMQDALDATFNEIGEASEGAIMSGIKVTTSLIENYEKIGKILTGLIAVYGTYKTGMLVATAIELGSVKAVWAKITATKAATLAQAAYNKVLMANPYALAATLIVGVVAAMWALHDSTTAVEKAQKSQSEYNNKLKEDTEKRVSDTQNLINAIKSETTAEFERTKALTQLQELYPSIFKNMDMEAVKLTNTEQLLKRVNEEQSKLNIEKGRERWQGLEGQLSQEKGRYERMLDSYSKTKNQGADLDIQKQKQLVLELEEEASAAFLQYAEDMSIKNASDTGKNIEKTTYQQDLAKTKSDWEKAKKGYESLIKDQNATSKEVKEAKENLEAKEKAYKELGGVITYESGKDKIKKQTESIIEQNKKIIDLEHKQNLERKRISEDLSTQLAQSEIDAMIDSSDKKQKQRELDNKKEIQSLERQKNDYIQAIIQFEKEKFEAQEELKFKQDKNYTKKTFDSSSVSVNTSAFDALISNASKKQLNEQIREQEDAWNEYLIKFGNYQEKRKAIIDKYDKEIQSAITEGNAATLEKEKQNAVDELDNSIKNSTSLMGQLFVDASKKSVNEIQKIIDKADILMQYLGSVKNEQGSANINGKEYTKKDILSLGISENSLQNLETSTDEVESLRMAIEKLKEELASRSPFKLLEKQIESAAQKINKGGKDNIAQGIFEIGNSIKEFMPAVSQFGQDLGNIFGNDDLANNISNISNAIGGLGKTASGVGQIMSGDIVGGAMNAVSGISSVVSAFEGLFGADYSRYNEMVAQYDVLNSVWDDLINKKLEYIDISYGEEATKAGKEAIEIAEKSIESYRILGRERLNAGASAGSHSIGVRIRKGMSSEGWEQLKNASQKIGFDYGSVAEGRMTGLFDLTEKQLEKLKQEAPTFWAKLDGDVRDYLDKIIDGEERIEEIQNQISEQLTHTTFDSVFDNFIDTLMDMKASSKDAAEDISEYFMRAMLSNQIGALYQDKLKKWYEKFSENMKNDGTLDEKEREDLMKEYMGYVDEAMKLRDELASATGYDKLYQESYQQESSRGSFETISQDTGDELSGRFAALQITGESILNVNTEVRNIADEIRDIQVNSYLELVGIRENTGISAKYLKDIRADISEVKKNTAGLASR